MKQVFKEIDQYWSEQKNNEIYLRGEDVEPGSARYWEIIETERHRYLYYLSDILQFYNKGQGDTLLEVGSGMGIDLAFFIRHGFKGTGIDIAQEHLFLAARYFEHKGLKADLHHMNCEQLEFPSEKFDCAYSFGVLHHTQNPPAAIDEIYRVLKKGGRCVVMLYHKHSLNNLVHVMLRLPYDNIRDLRPGGKDAGFVYRYSRAEVRRMFKKFKRVTIKIEYLYGAGWEPVYSWTPTWLYRVLSRIFGWHLVIMAEK